MADLAARERFRVEEEAAARRCAVLAVSLHWRMSGPLAERLVDFHAGQRTQGAWGYAEAAHRYGCFPDFARIEAMMKQAGTWPVAP